MTTDTIFNLVMGLRVGGMALGAERDGVAPPRRVLKMTIQASYRRQMLGTVGLDITYLLLMAFNTIAVKYFIVGLRRICG